MRQPTLTFRVSFAWPPVYHSLPRLSASSQCQEGGGMDFYVVLDQILDLLRQRGRVA